MEPSSSSPLILHTDASHSWGGQEIRVLTELREMQRQGFRVGLVAAHGTELVQRAARESIPVYPVAPFSKLNPSSWFEVWNLLRRLRPTVVNTHSSEDSWVAGAMARLVRTPLIIRTRHVQSPISSKVSYLLFPHLILTCSGAITQQLVEDGIPASKTVVVSTGNDVSRFRFSSENRQRIRQRYDINDDTILVGNVGFLRSYKGHPFILKTAVHMPARYRFMLVGDGEDRQALESLARELGVDNRVIFAGHQEEPEAFYSAFDLCFFSSNKAEGISQSLVQSLINGLPVLACRIPSTEEALRPLEHYRLVDYDDVEAACRALESLTPISREDTEGQSRTAAERYGLSPMVHLLLETYRRHGIVPGNAR
ncbi:MAG: glycosyltransferase [Desulfobulbus sp.]|jgi:glycosyltransferase involved in cell wall biosynthesis